jgi:hypothetical protein
MQLPEVTIASQSLLKTGFRNASQVEVLPEVSFIGYALDAATWIQSPRRSQHRSDADSPSAWHSAVDTILSNASLRLRAIFFQVHPVVASIGLANLALLWLGEKFLRNRPIADRVGKTIEEYLRLPLSVYQTRSGKTLPAAKSDPLGREGETVSSRVFSVILLPTSERNVACGLLFRTQRAASPFAGPATCINA